MCMKSNCGTCNKATWWGCGMHVPGVLDKIPENERCTCEPKVEKEGKMYPPQGPALGVAKAALGFGGAAKEKEEL